jgi:hypothetical protein
MEDEPTPNNYGDTMMLPFPTRERRKKKDGNEQFLCSVEMVEKTHVSVLLMDVLHIPSYSKFIKDIINKKRPLPSTEVVKLIEECSAAILNELPKKKQDLGCPTISCSIGAQQFDHALFDLGAVGSHYRPIINYQLGPKGEEAIILYTHMHLITNKFHFYHSDYILQKL